MVCEHLAKLEAELIEAGIKETYRGQAWSDNCREWVYFDVVLNTESLEKRLKLSPCVVVHENLDQKSGTERGFYCETCKDGVMGRISSAEIFK